MMLSRRPAQLQRGCWPRGVKDGSLLQALLGYGRPTWCEARRSVGLLGSGTLKALA